MGYAYACKKDLSLNEAPSHLWEVRHVARSKLVRVTRPVGYAGRNGKRVSQPGTTRCNRVQHNVDGSKVVALITVPVPTA